jgi:serine kinase
MAKKCSSAFLDEVPWSKETTEQLKARGFEFEEKIGYGSFATVYKATMNRNHKSTTVACKMINLKDKSARYRDKFFPREIEATRTLQHKYLVHVYEVVNDSTGNFCFIFMQLAKSDLLKEIEKGPGRKIPETQGRIWSQQMIEGLMYLHSHHWVHRDLKVENILISSENTVLISDFGFMRQQRPDILSETHCGSLAYAAPEVISPTPGSKKGAYDGFIADVWSVGVILFVMHTGEMPFDDSDGKKVRAQQLRVAQIVDTREMSSKLKDLIKGLLNTDPKKRMTLKQALDSSWIKNAGIRKSVGNVIKSAFSSIVGSKSQTDSSLKLSSASSAISAKSGVVHKSSGSLTLSTKSSSGSGTRGQTGSAKSKSGIASSHSQVEKHSKPRSKDSSSGSSAG